MLKTWTLCYFWFKIFEIIHTQKKNCQLQVLKVAKLCNCLKSKYEIELIYFFLRVNLVLNPFRTTATKSCCLMETRWFDTPRRLRDCLSFLSKIQQTRLYPNQGIHIHKLAQRLLSKYVHPVQKFSHMTEQTLPSSLSKTYLNNVKFIVVIEYIL